MLCFLSAYRYSLIDLIDDDLYLQDTYLVKKIIAHLERDRAI